MSTPVEAPVSGRPGARTAWAVWLLALGIAVGSLAIPGLSLTAGDVLELTIMCLAFGTVGAVIASHQPRIPIGWLYLGFALVAAFVLVNERYAYYGTVVAPGSLPGSDVAASFAAHVWHTAFGFFVFSVLLFPNGHLPSPRWRYLAGFALFTYVVLVVSGPFDRDFQLQLVPWSHPLASGVVAEVGSGVYTACIVTSVFTFLPVAALSLLVRLRRARGAERQQIKWFVYGVAFVLAAFPASVALVGDGRYGVWLLPAIPISAGIGILRYGLYDIDLVINKTVVYGGLTVVLAAAYLASVLVLQAAFGSFTPNSGVAVAASTLAVAALFRPVRNRIQAGVDRRFYRQRYDGKLAVESFSAQLRDTVELSSVARQLTGVVTSTVQPAQVSVWLRRSEP